MENLLERDRCGRAPCAQGVGGQAGQTVLREGGSEGRIDEVRELGIEGEQEGVRKGEGAREEG